MLIFFELTFQNLGILEYGSGRNIVIIVRPEFADEGVCKDGEGIAIVIAGFAMEGFSVDSKGSEGGTTVDPAADATGNVALFFSASYFSF